MEHRILVACDGSDCAERAVALVGATAWPPGTHIRLVTALPTSETAAARAMGLNAGLLAAFEEEGIATTSAMLGGMGRSIERSGWTVETAVVRGRASDAVAAAAREWGATLLVVGSRGHGALGTMLMGSTSAELIDMAPCPVLVARTATLLPILLATDGSEDARLAEQLVAGLPGLAGASVRVVSVAELETPWEPALTPWEDAQTRLVHATYVEEKRAHQERIAGAVVDRLAAAGIAATWEVRTGDVASQVIEAAREHEAALVVIGSRGLTGLARLVVGSVARNILVHAPVSVLVVRARSEAGDDPTA
jgi:nucleotide-binding universal stress UspA family protein